MARPRPCTPDVRRGRMHKAHAFLDAADLIADGAKGDVEISDVYVTLCVHAGIAASDVICCARLGEHAQGDDHNDAVTLLSTADKDSAKHLRMLLNIKSKAGYSHRQATANDAKRAGRAAAALVQIAERAG